MRLLVFLTCPAICAAYDRSTAAADDATLRRLLLASALVVASFVGGGYVKSLPEANDSPSTARRWPLAENCTSDAWPFDVLSKVTET